MEDAAKETKETEVKSHRKTWREEHGGGSPILSEHSGKFGAGFSSCSIAWDLGHAMASQGKPG